MNVLNRIDDALGLHWRRALWVIASLGVFMIALVAGGLAARAEGIAKASKVADTGATLVPVGELSKAAGWTGFHAYGAVGYNWSRSDFERWNGADTHIDANAAMITGGVGYDMQFSNIVVGVLADVSWSNLDAAWQDRNALALNGEWFVGARLGFLVTPTTLLYGVGGYTEAIDGKLSFKLGQDLGNLAGLTYGGGVEHVLASGWTLKAEYRFVQYNGDAAPVDSGDGLKNGSGIDTGTHAVRLGIGKRF